MGVPWNIVYGNSHTKIAKHRIYKFNASIYMETINVKKTAKVKVYASNARQRRHKREFEQKEMLWIFMKYKKEKN